MCLCQKVSESKPSEKKKNLLYNVSLKAQGCKHAEKNDPKKEAYFLRVRRRKIPTHFCGQWPPGQPCARFAPQACLGPSLAQSLPSSGIPHSVPSCQSSHRRETEMIRYTGTQQWSPCVSGWGSSAEREAVRLIARSAAASQAYGEIKRKFTREKTWIPDTKYEIKCVPSFTRVLLERTPSA